MNTPQKIILPETLMRHHITLPSRSDRNITKSCNGNEKKIGEANFEFWIIISGEKQDNNII